MSNSGYEGATAFVTFVKCSTRGDYTALTCRRSGADVGELHVTVVSTPVLNSSVAKTKWVVGPITSLVGTFRCPHCGSLALQLCESCHQLSCGRALAMNASCPWCHSSGSRDQSVEDSLHAWADL